MKLVLAKPLKELDGTEVKNGDKTVTMDTLIIQSLTILDSKEADMSGDERYKLYKIADKVAKADEVGVDLKSEEIALIKKRVGVMFGPIVVGRIYDLLEGEDA